MLTIRKSLIGALFSLFSFVCIDVFAQSADLIIQKTGPNQVYVGEYMQYTFTITNNGPNSVSNATWNDNLPSGMTNATFISCTSSGGAVCPSGGNISLTNTNFSGTIPSLPVNGQIIMIIGMNAPAPANGTSFSNTATVSVPAGTTEIDPTTNSATFNTTLLATTDISTIKTVNKTSINCGALPDTIEYEVAWVNGGPSAANGIRINEFFDVTATPTGTGNATFTFPISVFGETWYSSPGSSTLTDTLIHPSFLFNQFTGQSFISTQSFTVPVWEAGDTIRLKFKLSVSPPTVSGCGRNVTMNFRNRAYFTIPGNITLIDTNSLNDNSTQVSTLMTVCTAPACPTTDISTIKTVNKTSINCGALPDTIEYEVAWVNGGPSAANGIRINEFFDVTATPTGTGNATFTFPISVFGETWYSSPGSSTLTDTLIHPSFLFNQFTGQSFISTQSFTVPVWEAGDTIRLKFKLSVSPPTVSGCGRNVTMNFRNRAYFTIPGNITLIDTNSLNDNSTQVSTLMTVCTAPACPTTDISTIKTVNKTSINCGALPDTIEYEVAWVNGGPSAANGIRINEFFDVTATPTGTGNATFTFPISVFGETWYSSPGSSTLTDTLIHPSFLFNQFTGQSFISTQSFTVPVWEAGDTIRLKFKLSVSPPTVSGCGRNVTMNFRNRAYFTIPGNITLIDTNSLNDNSTQVSTILNISAIDLAISKNVNPVILNNNDTLTMTITLQNAPGGAPASTAVWLDTLPTTFTYLPSTLTCTPTGGAVCGSVSYNPTTRVLTQTNVNMPSNSQLVITLKGIVNSLYTITQYTRAYAIAPCVDCVPATNFTETNYQIFGLCDTIKAGDDGSTTICDNSSSTIDLFSIITGEYGGGTWSRTSGTGGTFNAGAGTFTPSVGSTSSTFEYIIIGTSPCPNDTSVATIVINPTFNTSFDSTICSGSSVIVCGTTYTTAGTHVTTCQTVNGCDSIVTLNLTVNPTYNVTIDSTICDGQTVTICGTTYTTSGTHITTCQTVNGCDSIVTLNLTVNPVYSITIDSTICNGQSVTICGTTYTTAGTHVTTCQTVNGCDSIITLNLTINPVYNITIDSTICDGQSVTICGTTYTTAGTHVTTCQTVNGCDSTVTLNLTVNPTYNVTVDSTICDGESVTICGITYTTGGTHVTTCQTVDGCDSIITLNLTVNPLVSVSNIQTTCAPNGLSYTVSFDMSGTAPFTVTGGAGTVTGSSFTSDPITAGTGYNFNVTDANNCNTVNVSGNSPNCSCPPVFTTIDSTICEPNTVTICGNVHSSSGTYTDTCKNINGCDSIVTLNLTVNPVYNITINATTCDALQAGTVVENLTTVNGCDSIVTTITTLLPSYKLTIDSTICAPNTVTICGNIHSSTGTYVDTCKTVDGCDSIITLNLTVNPLVSVSNIQTICAPNGLSYTVSFDMSGTAPFTVTGGAGTVTGSSFTSDPITAGTGYNFNVTDANNCNTVNVSGNSPNCSCPPVFTTIDSTICEPNTVTICGNVHSSSGTYTDTCKNITGCDSIVTLNLTVNQIYNITISETTCDATQAGTTVQNLTTLNGCDSIVTTITTLLPSYKLTIDSTICAPNTVTICGNIHSSTGTYVDTCKTVDGCDSIITLNLTVNPLVSVSNIQTTCAPNGLSYTVSFDMSGTAPFTVTGGAGTVTGSSFTSDPITAGTGYNFNVTDANNCNTVNVSGNSPNCSCPPVFTTIDSTICEPNTVTICGNVHSSTGTYTDTCKNINGCDSIVTLNLTVNQIYNITINETTCDATQAGTTVQNLTTVNGCDSIVTTITTLLPSYKLTIDSTICAPNTVTICGNIHSSTGTYVDTCKTVDGCDSIITLNLTVNPLVSVSNIQTTCAPNGLSYTVSFDMSGTAPFTVTGGAGTVTGSSFTSDPIARGVGYNFTVTDGGNCNSVNVSGVAPNCVIPCPTIDCGGVKVRKN